MYYTSTRDNSIRLTASEAVLKGLSDDGGLFVPSEIPALSKSLREISEMDYKETAYTVMKDFLFDYTEEELRNCIDKGIDFKVFLFDMQNSTSISTKGYEINSKIT